MTHTGHCCGTEREIRPVTEGKYLCARKSESRTWCEYGEEKNGLNLLMDNFTNGFNVLFVLESYMSKNSEDDELAKKSKRSVRKRGRSTDEYSEADEDEEEEGKPSRKRLHRIETDEEESCDNTHGDAAQPARDSQPRVLPAEQESTKRPYRIDSDEEEDFENVSKVESPLDYSLVDLPSTNGQSPGKAIENLIGKPAEKPQTPKDSSTASASLAPNGTSGGQEAGAPEEEEDELLRVTDLVDYVCNSEQL